MSERRTPIFPWRTTTAAIAAVATAPRRTRSARGASRAAFTLTELLVVIALIVLLIALALPAFSFITGSKSVDAGQNVVAAMLGRARSIAIADGRAMGVAFWFDRTTERTAMAIVKGEAASGGPEDYDAWTTSQAAGTTISYKTGDIVHFAGWNMTHPDLAGTVLGNTPNEAGVGNAPSAAGAAQAVPRKFVVRRYACLQDISSSTTDNAPPPPDDADNANANWAALPAAAFELFEADVEYLQPGIGLQLVNDRQDVTPPANSDKYLRTGVILFGPDGQLSTIEYGIDAAQPLGQLIGMTAGEVFPIPSALPLIRTHTALMLYEREPFLNRPGTEEDMRSIIGGTGPASAGVAGPPGTEEAGEEQWLDENGLLLLVNRYNGTLVRSE